MVKIAPYAFVAALAVAGCSRPDLAGPGPDATKVAAAASQIKLGEEVSALAANDVTVYFPAGGASLTRESEHQLDLAVRLFRDANPVAMFSTGYSDRTGDDYSNLLLSAKRAEAVKRGLVARGLPADRLLIRAFGASDVADRAGPAAQENRRVVITWRLL